MYTHWTCASCRVVSDAEQSGSADNITNAWRRVERRRAVHAARVAAYYIIIAAMSLSQFVTIIIALAHPSRTPPTTTATVSNPFGSPLRQSGSALASETSGFMFYVARKDATNWT